MLPSTLGRYTILGQLATGGMAEILLAQLSGPSSFERPVVIKRILPHLARSTSFVDMFLEEAQIAARIRHPRVVQVHELVREDRELFLVMEYVEGETVGGIMRRLWSRNESLDAALAAHIIAEACAGLHAAHELENRQGAKEHLVHRDVSPQNIMLSYAGEVKVLDFGIAKAQSRVARTEAGRIRGKFEYMSPEQCKGEPLDRRSDVFGLGTLLYELTVGARLFKRPNELLTMRAICEEAVLPPSQVRSAYPRCLEVVCLRALARRREDRYETAAEMRRDLVSAIRELGDAGLHDEALANLMQRLFPDRMRQKLDMLRSVRAGVSPAAIPAGESDTGVELPPLPALPPRLSARWRGLAAVASVAMFVGVLFLGRFWSNGEPLTPSPMRRSIGSIRVLARTPPAKASANSEIDLSIDSVPAGATIRVDGHDRGITPTKVRLPRGSHPVAVSLSHAGFVPLTNHVVPDVPQRLTLHLRALPSVHRNKSQKLGSGRPAASQEPVFGRFD